MVRSLHVVSSLRLSAGGPTQSVTQLCEALNRLGHPAEIATLDSPDSLPWDGLTAIHSFPIRFPERLRRSPKMWEFLLEHASRFDLLHLHGLWEWPGIYAREMVQLKKVPMVLSPRGMIEPWSLSQGRWRKLVAMQLWERKNLEAAALFHATSSQEANSLRARGLSQPIVVIPNGIHSRPPTASASATRPTALFLSRLHPKKGLDVLLHAWAGIQSRIPDWDLVIAGPDEAGYGAQMQTLAQSLGLKTPTVRFVGEIHGDAKWQLLAEADLFVLPSHSENFGNVILEALSQGTAVLTTRGTPWSQLHDRGCGWCVPLENFKEFLVQALQTPRETLGSMGQRGASWAEACFGWSQVATAMAQAYAWRFQGAPPSPDLEVLL